MKHIETGQRIKSIRQSLGLTMTEFGKTVDLEISKGNVCNWEKGRNLPNNKRLKLIAELGNTTVDELLGNNYVTCPRCKNEKVKKEHNYCSICGLKMESAK